MPPRHKSPSNGFAFAGLHGIPAWSGVRAGPARVAAFFRTSAALRSAPPYAAHRGFQQCRKRGGNPSVRFSVVSTRTGKATPSTYLHTQLDVTRRETNLPASDDFAKVAFRWHRSSGKWAKPL